MDALMLVIAVGVVLGLAYRWYGGFLGGRRVFEIDPARPTPATTEQDGRDFVPTRRSVLFGHHFTSIAGTGPIVGPAIAVMWGWVPAVLWVVLGSIFVGAVHDFGSLVVSLRNRGRSIGDIAGDLLGPRARFIFLLVLILGLWVVLAIFGLVIATVLKQFPSAITPVLLQIPLAAGIGVLIHRKGRSLVLPSIVALVVMYLTVIFGDVGVLHGFNAFMASLPIWAWTVGLLAYCYVASVLPVWTLLQPRDYINALQLLSCLALIVVGLVVAAVFGGSNAGWEGVAERPALSIVAPAFNWQPVGAPPMLPVLFITIACGACSGFHCLVSSGTTSKQVASEADARAIGYGSMLTEGFLATLVIVACVAGIGLGTTKAVGTDGLGLNVFDGVGEAARIPAGDGSEYWLTVIGSDFQFTDATGYLERWHGLSDQRRGWDQPDSVDLGLDQPTAPCDDPADHPTRDPEDAFGTPFVRPLADLQYPAIAAMPEGVILVSVPGAGVDAALTDDGVIPEYVLRGHLAFLKQYESWSAAGSLGAKVGAFVRGSANLVASLGIPLEIAISLMAVMVASFAATTLDTACRLQRYVVQELSTGFLPRAAAGACTHCGYDRAGLQPDEICPECASAPTTEALAIAERAARRGLASIANPFRWLSTTHGATLFAVITAAALALAPRPGVPWNGSTAGTGGLLLWPLFGATNQLLAGLAFIVIAAWLRVRGKPRWFVVIPGVFMLCVPFAAMIWQAFIGNDSNPSWVETQDWLLVGVAGATLLLEVALLIEVARHWRSGASSFLSDPPDHTGLD